LLTENLVYFGHRLLNRITSQTFAVGGTAEYAHDANSNRTELTYPNAGGTAYYTYNEVDRMTRVHAPSDTWTDYTYDQSGNRTKSVWGNGAWTYYTYDDASRVSSIRHFDDDGAPLAYFDYDRDARANITTIARLDGLATYYGYDAADRLASEDWKDTSGTLYAFSYDYDLNGNRTHASLLGVNTYYTYDDADAVLTRTDSGGTTDFTYDLDGNLEMIEEPGGTTYFEHASHGLVSKITPLGGTAVEFGYDALLRRTRMTEGATTTYFRHDGINLLEIDDGGTLTKLVHGYTEIDGIGSVIEVDVDGTLYYFHQDHRGTLRQVTNASGTVIWDALCDAWGCVLTETGANPSVFFYQGQAWFKKTINGRDYYISPTRIYEPRTGGFIERDPLPHSNGTTGHVGFQSSPLMYTDASGLKDECICGPDVTDMFINLLKYALRWRVNEARRYKGGSIPTRRALAWLFKWGGRFDWTTSHYAIFGKCPKGQQCKNTYWLLGECVHDHWIGNFMYGFIGRLLEVPDIVMNDAAARAQSGGPGDPKGWTYADPPWDRAGYQLGRTFFSKVVTHDDRGYRVLMNFGSQMLTGILKAATDKDGKKLWAQANLTDIDLRPSLHVRYPTPHARGYRGGVCAPCPQKLPRHVEKIVGFPVGRKVVRGKWGVVVDSFERTDELE
jgi:YD repeat-containing protein